MPEKKIPIHCPLCCDQPFEDQQSLFFHLRALRNNLFCTICSDRFDTLENLIAHLSRKCNGPTSLDAKRKCLMSINSQQGGYQPAECTSTENVGESETIGGLSDIDHAAASDSDSSQPNHSLKSTNIVNSGSSNQLNSTIPEVVIPSEFQSKLSKSVTLSIGRPAVPTENLPLKSNSSSTASGVSFNSMPAVPDSLSVVSAVPCSSTESLAAKTSTKENTTKSQTSPTKANKRQSEEQVKLVQKKPLTQNANLDLLKKSNCGLAATVKSNGDKVCSFPSSINVTENSPPRRKRGRPRKNPLPTSSSAKKTVQNPEPEYVLPDILDDAELSRLSESVSESGGPGRHENVLLKTYVNQEGVSKHGLPKSMNNKCNVNSNMKKNKVHTLPNSTEDGRITSEVETKLDNLMKEEKEVNSEEDEEYTCSACNVRFSSIYDHIKEFHNGEEVVVEVPEEEINEELKAYQGSKEDSPSKRKATSDMPDNDREDVLKNTSGSSQFKDNHINDLSSPHSKKHSDELNQTSLSPLKTLDFLQGKWVKTTSRKVTYYQFVVDHRKQELLTSELCDSSKYVKAFNATFKDLFERPKVNLIEVRDIPGAPFFTDKKVDFNKPIPIYIKERQTNKGLQLDLGGTASFVLANPKCRTPVPKSSTLISVMNVVVASDKMVSIENVVFYRKPCENMIPFLEDVNNPLIPLLSDAKILKWKCSKCFTETWKFPLTADSHMCNTCLICHKPFVSSISLRKHMIVHRKDGSKICTDCNKSFANRGLLASHLDLHVTHTVCKTCKLFVPKENENEHDQLHRLQPHQQFPCSACRKVFGSNNEVKSHEVAFCSRLVAKFNCSLCDKKFFSLTALSLHTRTHKSVDIQFPCRFCNKTFVKEKEQCLRKSAKREPASFIQKIWHERIHSRERPYSCQLCPKRFRSLPHQQSHTAYAHEGAERGNKTLCACHVCDKVFLSSSSLSSHMLTHSLSN